MSAADAEILAMYGVMEEARRQQIRDYHQELAEQERADSPTEPAEGS